MKTFILVVSALLIMPFSVFAQSDGEGSSPFSLNLGFGIESLYNGEYTPGGTESKTLIYQNMGLHPQVKTEKFDMILDFVLRFRFDGSDEEDEFKIIRKKSYPVKPMTEEEAILQMNLLGHEFFVFRNQNREDAFSIVYKRKQGDYGLIETK